jgi:hypothetical protein
MNVLFFSPVSGCLRASHSRLVVDFEPKDPWFKPQAAQKTKKTKVFFQNDPFPSPNFLRIDPENCIFIP